MEQNKSPEICHRLLTNLPEAPNYDPQKISNILCGS
jgi:hypothetical protein